MKNRMIRETVFTFCIVILMVTVLAVGAVAQTNTPEPNFASDLSNIINGLGLPQDQFEGALKLTRSFLTELQKANQELTQLMTSQQTPPGVTPAGSQGAGAQLDPKSLEKINILQRGFGIKLEQYKLDLSDTIGEANAAKIADKIGQIIPRVLLQNSQIAAANHTNHSGMTGTPTPNPPTNGLTEVPLGAAPNNSGNGNMGTMPGMTTPGTSNNSGMNNMPGMTMPGSPGNTPNNTNGTGNNTVNLQILLQLQTTNSMLMQMLSIISSQSNSENLKAQLQPIYQLIANQSVLIQMLYANLMAGSSTTNGAAGSSGGGMGNMGGMGMM